MYTAEKEKKRKTPPVALPHLDHVKVAVVDEFTRSEVAEIFGNRIHRSQISRYQGVLACIEQYRPITRDGIWGIYVFLCWRQKRTGREGTQWAWKEHFQQEFEELGEEAFLQKYVYGIGGSRQDCDRLIDQYLAKKNTKKFA